MSRREITSNNNSETSSTHSGMLNNKRQREDKDPHQSRKEKIQKIFNNFTRMEQIFKKEEVRRLFESLGKFSYEEFSKFFQNIANHEFISLTFHQTKSKDPITIDPSLLKFDPNILLNQDNPSTDICKEGISNIHKFIVKNTKEKVIFKKESTPLQDEANKKEINNNNTQINISTKDYLESITQNMKTLSGTYSLITVQNLKHIIKLYSTFVHSNNIIIEQEEDKIIRDLINQVSSINNSNDDFYSLCIYWLYTEYLFASESNNFYRYNRLLEEIISMTDNINKNKNVSSYVFEYTNFISNIPYYNTKLIENILNYHNKYFTENYDLIKQLSKAKIVLVEQLPYLCPMKKIYINIIKNDRVSEKEKETLREQLLNSFINMSMNDYNHINARAIEFLFPNIYDIKDTDQYEEKYIKKIAIDHLKELISIKDETSTNENKKFIEQRFPLYLHLCGKDIEVIKEFPEVYANCGSIVKKIFDNYMKLMMKTLDKFNAENLISKCDDKSEEIVKCVINSIYSVKGVFDIKDKLFRNIRSYYTKSYPTLFQGVIAICDKIPINDFYNDSNFVLEKINQNENEEGIYEILKILNNNSNDWIFGSEFENYISLVKNKVLFYILYYYRYIYNSRNNLFEEILKKLNKFFNQEFTHLSIEQESDFIEEKNIFGKLCVNYLSGEGFIEMIDNFMNDGIDNTDNKVYDFYIESISEVLNEKVNSDIQDDAHLLGDNDYDRIVYFIKKRQSNPIIQDVAKKFNEKIKNELRGKDLILFSDL